MKLKDIYNKFPDEKSCIKLLEQLIWNGKPQCPYCNMRYTTRYLNENRYKCNTCNMSFSVTVNTVFHKTKVELQKWLYLISIMNEPGKKHTVRALAEELSITKDSAARMVRKLKSPNPTDINLITIISTHLL